MAYITYEELVLRYPLVKKWGSEDANETFVNSYMIYYAEHEVNSRLASHYSTPFSAAHPTVKDLTFDMCKYRMLQDQDPKKASEFAKFVDERIEKLKNGDEYIFTGSDTVISPSGSGTEIWSTVQDYNPTHSMLDEDSQYTLVDSSRLYNEENLRS